jgi:hypothetical protein
VADALDPLLVNDQTLKGDIGLSEEQVEAFNAGVEAAKKGK